MNELLFETMLPAADSAAAKAVDALLAAHQLTRDVGIERFVLGYLGGRLVACAGLDGNIVKCVAVEPALRGESLALKLMTEVGHQAMARGQAHLFLYTKPENQELFEGCGFYLLATIPGLVCLMENTPLGARAYAERLGRERRPGGRIAGIVLNANPFTLGHQHLVRRASEECDHVHLFVVSEDASFFPYDIRLALVRAGLASLANVTVHPGSKYIVSRATFPTYFLKEQEQRNRASAGLDLLLFRNFVAPALGIGHRYVGTEPFCAVTLRYNLEMRRWLEEPSASEAPALEIVEIPRLEASGRMISATEVRDLYRQSNFEALEELVPETTLRWLREHPHETKALQ